VNTVPAELMTFVGRRVEPADGAKVGGLVGRIEGISVGAQDGAADGSAVGSFDGSIVGAQVGFVGTAVGAHVGRADQDRTAYPLPTFAPVTEEIPVPVA
jgi:hypothetical protein